MRAIISNFRSSEAGATLVEYGVALILAIVLGGTGLQLLGSDVGETMDRACSEALADAGTTCG